MTDKNDDCKTNVEEELPAPLLQFPCDFPMRIVGVRSDGFAQQVVDIIKKHAPSFNESEVQMKLSGKGNFLSLGVIIPAESQEQLDNIYRELTSREDIRFVL